MRGHEWHLVRRSRGEPVAEDVALVEVDVPDPSDGDVIVRNLVLSVEPYMRGRMTGESHSYIEPFPLNGPMLGAAVGRVVSSRDAGTPIGALVLHDAGWREYSVLPAAQVRVLPEPTFAPATYLGALNIPGMTAWVGLLDIGRCQPGDTVLVTSAAGAVGVVAVQLARHLGATVIGVAGSESKRQVLTERLGVAATFDHHQPAEEALAAALASVGRDGIDVFFDNTAGPVQQAAIGAMADRGRIVLCGAVAAMRATEPLPGPSNLRNAIWRRLRLEGFLVLDHDHRRPEFESRMSAWLRSGVIEDVHTVVGRGVEAAWSGFERLFGGDAIGKAVVTIAEDDV